MLSRGSFLNAIVALAAVGGSTNAVVHLLAIAGRLGIPLSLDDFDRTGAGVPLLVDLQPAGRLPDGGLPPRRRAARPCCARCGTCSTPRRSRSPASRSSTTWATPQIWDADGHPVARRAAAAPTPGIAVLYGNLAPDGAVIKPAAASPQLLQHRGRAVVFDSIEDFHARIDDPDLDVDADSVLVLRGCGPKGYPGMPEVANLPLPRKLLQQGVRDMVRICDGRMSGTAYGTVVLHVAPEAAAGGPLGWSETGDVDRARRGRPPARRRHPAGGAAARTPTRPPLAGYAAPSRGWERLYIDHVHAGRQRRGPRLPRRLQRRPGVPGVALTPPARGRRQTRNDLS